MYKTDFYQNIARTLLYYEIFDYPLTAKELFTLFPKNSVTLEEFKNELEILVAHKQVVKSREYYYLPQQVKDFSEIRTERTELAVRRLRAAKFFTLIMKQFPFVRGVFLSGELSKLVATKESDIDYVIVTAKNRLWITRAMLIMFKKTFLLNKKKYFCLNYFFSESQLVLSDRSYYNATEIAHLKPLYNFPLFLNYINANGWIKKHFPNYSIFHLTSEPLFETRGIFQKFFELFLTGKWVDNLDRYIMKKMKAIWQIRYKEYDTATHERLFLCTPDESRAFIGDFSSKIELLYREKLKLHHLE